MALFKNLFSKKEQSNSPKGFVSTTISAIDRLSKDTVKVTLDMTVDFIPGQYLTFIVPIDGQEVRRSYSICSGKGEALSVAVKHVPNGIISGWFNTKAEANSSILVSKPEGGFIRPEGAKNCVAIAAGSGITPIMSIAKDLGNTGGQLELLFGNKTVESILFKSELDAASHVQPTYFLSNETVDGYQAGRIDKEALSNIIKARLDILKSDCFFICGPEQMIVDAVEVLELFGVAKEKIKFELFTTPILMKPEAPASSDFEGTSKVTIILDDEEEHFELSADGMSILEKANKVGLDAPYSCKGGVCSSCKAKVRSGKASMTMNYALTDREVEEGYILTCQAHPASEEITISYDDV